MINKECRKCGKEKELAIIEANERIIDQLIDEKEELISQITELQTEIKQSREDNSKNKNNCELFQ